MMIRVGNKVINLANAIVVDLDYRPDSLEENDVSDVVVEFVLEGADELDDGERISHPRIEFFSGREAEAIRRHLKNALPDLLDA